MTTDTELAADYLEGKVDRIAALMAADRVQPNTLQLPSEAELERARIEGSRPLVLPAGADPELALLFGGEVQP